LRVFCDLVETKSFLKTGLLNGISQSAVSQQLQALEANLGARLFARSRRAGVSGPTTQGLILYEAAKQILKCINLTVSRIRASKVTSPDICIPQPDQRHRFK
jgi:DNA-binding transcriptional LysR family regulator